MRIKSNAISFYIGDLLKQSRPGNTGSVIRLSSYPPERKICIYTYLKQYLCETKILRGTEKSLFISFKKPHKAVTTDTIARWLKLVMHMSGLNTQMFTAHSTRAASVSAASRSKVPVDDILRTAGWASEQTFKLFYKKPIMGKDTFATGVLRK
jgi:hypothetical protein